MSSRRSHSVSQQSTLASALLFRDHNITASIRHAIGFAALAYATPILAQVATGDILGNITDNSGSVVAGASIRVENVGTHEVRTFITKGNGAFVFSALQPGTYTLSVNAPSFKISTTANIVLSASDRIRIDSHLQPGSVSDTVEVSATPTSLQTDTTTVGSTITEKTLVDTPLNGRNYIALVQVQAGVNAGSSGTLSLLTGGSQSDRRLTSSVSANGQEEIFNNNLVDGLDNNSRIDGAPLLRPSVETIGEVRTDINLYTAEVGRTGGAAINVITKSGANQFHGSVYEFFRNDITDARNFFASTSILSRKPELRQNQYGGSLSGPIFRNRTFFFVDYEGFRRIDGNATVALVTVPTAAEQATPGYLGDIINPFTKLPLGTLPTAAIDPTSLGYFKLFPLPNVPNAGATNNFLADPSASLNTSTGDLRIDHHFNDSNLLFARYSYNRAEAYNPSSFPAVNGVLPGGALIGNGGNTVITHNGQFGYTHIFTPSLLMELKAGYTYFLTAETTLNQGRNLNDQAPYTIPNANECRICSGLATINVIGYGGLGDSVTEPTTDGEHNTQFAGSFTYVHGRQTFKMGGGLIRRNFSADTSIYPKGLFNFAPIVVLPTATTAAVYLPSLQNFLLGAPYISLRQAYLTKPYDRTWESNGFFQDDWRAADNLTLNFGLRYDVFTKPNAKYGNYDNFDLGSLSIIQNSNGNIQNEFHDFGPRFGFDATIAPGTVVRGGFGLSYFVADATNTVVLNNPPFGFNQGTVVNRTPISTTGVSPAVAQSTAPASLFGTVIAKDPHLKDSYLEQMNLLMQKEYRGTVLTVGYVAELGRHLFDQVPNLNIPAPSGSAVVAAAPYATQLPKVTTINYLGSFGASSYNSFQASLERRVSHGLTANVNYTYAHNLDDVIQVFDGDGQTTNGFGDLPSQISTYDYGNSPLDLQSRFAGFFSYDLPFGKAGSHFYKLMAGGFRFNGLGFWQTGSPFTVTSSVTQANSLATINLPTVTTDKPNVIASPIGNHSLSQFFNISAFAQQAVGTAGNERRNQIFGPHIRRGDLSLFKTIPIHDAVQLELRAECFNVTNTPNFGQPNSTITGSVAGSTLASNASGFGSITTTAFGYSGRQFQFAGRFSF